MNKTFLITLLLLVALFALHAQANLTNIRFGNYDFGTRVVVETDSKTNFDVTNGKDEVIIKVDAVLADEKLKKVKTGSKHINSMKVDTENGSTTITFKSKSLYRSVDFPISGDPYKIVIDILVAPGGYDYQSAVGIANYLMHLNVRKYAEVEFDKISKLFPKETGYNYYYGLNCLKQSHRKKAISLFKLVKPEDKEYSKAVSELKKLGVKLKTIIAEKPKVTPKKVEPKPVEVVEVEEVRVIEEDSLLVANGVDEVIPFHKTPFGILTIIIIIIIILASVYFIIKKRTFKSKFDESAIKFDPVNDLESKRNAIRKLYDQGWTVRAISKELGIDQEDIYITVEEDSPE
ncbi:MAG: hypothetical protein P9L91_05945 [Candidatus Zophobacter franzmannii]|nr:hypothetical protein [Candidatus Zophobacter franzmannii]